MLGSHAVPDYRQLCASAILSNKKDLSSSNRLRFVFSGRNSARKGVVNALVGLVNMIGCCSQCDWVWTMQATVSSVPPLFSPIKRSQFF